MPITDAHVFDIARVIQLAIAPVVMLTAVAGILNALLGRLERRIRLVIVAIALAVLSALLICLLIGGAFVGAYIATDISGMVAILFFASVVALTGSLLVFLREVILAAVSLHLEQRVNRDALP